MVSARPCANFPVFSMRCSKAAGLPLTTALDRSFLAKVISAYRVYAKKVPLKDGDYTIDHTALIYLMDRDGKFVAPFNLNRTPEEAAADLRRYL